MKTITSLNALAQNEPNDSIRPTNIAPAAAATLKNLGFNELSHRLGTLLPRRGQVEAQQHLRRAGARLLVREGARRERPVHVARLDPPHADRSGAAGE